MLLIALIVETKLVRLNAESSPISQYSIAQLSRAVLLVWHSADAFGLREGRSRLVIVGQAHRLPNGNRSGLPTKARGVACASNEG